MKNRVLSWLLVVAMLLTGIPMAAAVGVAQPGFSDGQVVQNSTNGPIGLAHEGNIDLPSGVAQPVELEEDEGKYAPSEHTPISKSDAYVTYEADDMVSFIVKAEVAPLLTAGYSMQEIAQQTASVQYYQDKQQKSLDAMEARMIRAFADSDYFQVQFTYKVATTGFAVTAKYGDLEKLRSLPGVESVYVSPMFDTPVANLSDNLGIMTSNSSTMIGSDQLNSTGYTGIGQRIAILDTGILLTHPNFQPLPEDKLEDPLTIEEIEGVWDKLNASETSLLCNAYHSTKIPYIFNYVALDYNVDHSYAYSDHGTHVAGIAAANKIESSEVVGVAPDAQLLVMQVFQQNGGAAWSHIMAALEDCVYLNVDTMNLSLGAAAGFTDDTAESEFNQVLKAFEDTGMQMLIASGNDTNNAYMNRTGMDMALAGNPDIGLAGTPSTYSSAMGVASIDNDGRKMLYITVGDRQIGFVDTAMTSATNFQTNLSGMTLEYVMVPGVGEPSDYEGLDVAGKVAVVSRGTTSFPEKQAAAQEAGAIACIVYNNVGGVYINMQINDGGDNIPCVFISKADGMFMGEQETKSFTVGTGDMINVKMDRAVSSFSSWGVTPDLKLKPEIAGVGGNVYSATDPQISGSFYAAWNGTSMATPQVAGAAAVMIEYFRENYNLDGAELRRAVANMMMSTAQVVMYDAEAEYSPRAQGAGLVDLVAGTTSGAYLSNPDAYENRPKGELGDDPDRTGKYSFVFEINNFSDKALTYTLDGSVLTETYYSGLIANAPTALNAKPQFSLAVEAEGLCYDFNDDGILTTADARTLLRHITNQELLPEGSWRYDYVDVNGDNECTMEDVDILTAYCAELEVAVDLTETRKWYEEEPVETVTVEPGTTQSIQVAIELTEEDMAYMEQFPNGIWVEGFIYANAMDEDGVTLNMPYVGFWGDWSDAPVFDEPEEEYASLYPTYMYTNFSVLGENPYIATGRGGEEYRYFSYSNPIQELDFGQNRNAKYMTFVVTNAETGEKYWEIEGHNITKSYFVASYGMVLPTYLLLGNEELWDGYVDGEMLPSGTKITYTVSAWLDDGDMEMDDQFTYSATLDTEYPEINNQTTMQESLRFENDRTYLTVEMTDDQRIAALIFLDSNSKVMGKYEIDNVPGEKFTGEYDITGFGSEFTILVADYACNEREIDVMLNLGEHNLDVPTPVKLDSDRLYGCETWDSAVIEGGWFSANKADMSDPRNETFDPANRYYSAEFVNGYIVAQSATTGHLELIVPGGTYWSSQVISENRGVAGDPYVWVLYDMAMKYNEGTTTDWDGNEVPIKDQLFAVGWYYMGDNDGDGKDDGYNTLFTVDFSDYGINVNEYARITGTEGELLTLGITTEGQMYGIDTLGILYSINSEKVWDDTVGDWGAYVVQCTMIGTTDFVNYTNYSGCNVIQSMGYDHNDGKMYWYAHSETANGASYIELCETFIVDLETAECEVVGNYGPGGQTALFIPHDMESDLFAMGVQATGFTLTPTSMIMVEGQSKRPDVTWQPWNAKPAQITWASSDETVATVDEYGFITAVNAGDVTISATAEVMLPGYWDTSTGDWIWVDGGLGDMTVEMQIEVRPSEDGIYSFLIADFKDMSNVNKWVTFSDQAPTAVTDLGAQKLEMLGNDGQMHETNAMWYGGAYVNGYVYANVSGIAEDGYGAMGNANLLYKFKVNEGETPAETTFGEPELVGTHLGMQCVSMAFDYNTSRMYCLEYNTFSLGIMDLETGHYDMLGYLDFIPTAMCVTPEGYLIVADQMRNLFTLDPDTLEATQIYYGQNEYSAYIAAMMYDYDTGCIYWNPCQSASTSPFFLVTLGTNEYSGELEATVMDMGDVSTKYGVEMSIMFAIPENEPEAKIIPLEEVSINEGEAITGLHNGKQQLTVTTVPARPTTNKKLWTSSDESVVTVDEHGIMTYVGVGTATVTVTMTNKDEDIYGGPFTDSIDITVLESGGELKGFLGYDMYATQYYDMWLSMNDYDLGHTKVGANMISTYSMRTGVYYDGYYYAYSTNGTLMRINAQDESMYTNIGTVSSPLTGMAVDFTQSVVYGVTLDGKLVTINLDTAELTEVATIDLSCVVLPDEYDTAVPKVYAIAFDSEGNLYGVGSKAYYYNNANLYRIDKETGVASIVMEIEGSSAFTSEDSLYNVGYCPQMTYDYTTDRLYFYSSYDYNSTEGTNGMYLIQLGQETPEVYHIGNIALDLGRGDVKMGQVMLSLLSVVNEPEELPEGKVNGIIMSRTSGRIPVGGTASLTAAVRPSNAPDTTVTWSSLDETVATVDQSGVVTGVAEGEVTIVATSNADDSIVGTCLIRVVTLEGSQPTAYTAVVGQDALYTFNPNLPGQTAEKFATISGMVTGVTNADNGLYITARSAQDAFDGLYYFDFTTKEMNYLGNLYTWIQICDIAYDAENELLYAVGGFYIWQFNVNNLDPASLNNYSGYAEERDYDTFNGVAVRDGVIYYTSTDWDGKTNIHGYTDKYLTERFTVAKDVAISTRDGSSEFACDAGTGLFYLTDVLNCLYTLDISYNETEGTYSLTTEIVDFVGDGLNITGLAIVPAEEE